MEPSSSLGPIDAQILWAGKTFSADALLEGFRQIKDEVNSTGVLNKAYIPILQGISPGEIQHAENAQDFSRKLVAEWLKTYKFKNWNTRSTSKSPVSAADKEKRADEIASILRDHKKWMTHGRSIHIKELEKIGLHITDYSKDAALFEAIRRYHTLMHITFMSNVYKIFETTSSQIMRMMAQLVTTPSQNLPKPAMAQVQHKCSSCGRIIKIRPILVLRNHYNQVA